MAIPLKYKLTEEMVDLISKIEVKKTLLANISIPNDLIKNLQRQSLLKSSLFSAKIEGNTLSIDELNNLQRLDSKLKERIEIENILSAFSFIDGNKNGKINLSFILALHGIVMRNISSDAGKLRKVPSAIFNQAGFPVYIPPSPLEIESLLKKLFLYINKKSNEHTLIKASLFHISFEKIHPFLDGNGRVGRLLFQAITLAGGYNFNNLLSIEELQNEKKEEYYAYLDKNDATSFIEFMLGLINDQSQKILDDLGNRILTREDLLLPRRKEILEIIRDHKLVSLDLIRRRFKNISPRMIRYDLKKLENEGFIIKLGATRGALYRLK